MRKSKKIITVIALVLCFSCLVNNSAIAIQTDEFDKEAVAVYTKEKGKSAFSAITEIIFEIFDVLFLKNEVTKPNVVNDTVKVRFIFVNFRTYPNFSFSSIKTQFWYGRKVKVLGYSGYFTYVQDCETEDKGYIFSDFLNDDEEGTISFKDNREHDHVYVGKTNSGRVKVVYNGNHTVKWFSEPEGYVSINQDTGVITGIKPGTVTVTAQAGSKSVSCTVTCFNEWKETETSTAQKSITIRKHPGNSYSSVATVSKGTTMTAKGDLADGSGWIYILANGNYGFIHISDFPGINYLMTVYHYYDQGYNIRFGSASTKIYDYASVLNDVMMDLFGLKVNSYVYSYTSPADRCKILRFDSVKSSNLASSCSKTGEHRGDSCLTNVNLRNSLINDKGSGTNVVTKAVWTGHIMDGHTPSDSVSESQTLVFTTANTVSYSSGMYSNRSSANIRYYSLYEITHEMGHQLGLVDGYCYKDGVGDRHCSNDNCFTCNREPVPNCIMAVIKSPTNSTNMFCEDCIKTINEHLKDHH